MRIRECKKLFIRKWDKYNKLCWLLKIWLDMTKDESSNDPNFILGLNFRILAYEHYFRGYRASLIATLK